MAKSPAPTPPLSAQTHGIAGWGRKEGRPQRLPFRAPRQGVFVPHILSAKQFSWDWQVMKMPGNQFLFHLSLSYFHYMNSPQFSEACVWKPGFESLPRPQLSFNCPVCGMEMLYTGNSLCQCLGVGTPTGSRSLSCGAAATYGNEIGWSPMD